MIYDDNNGHSSLALLLLLKELHSPVELFKLTGACIAIEVSCHRCVTVSLTCATLSHTIARSCRARAAAAASVDHQRLIDALQQCHDEHH